MSILKDPRFWQFLLTAELPFAKSEALIALAAEQNLSSDQYKDFFLRSPILTPAERARVEKTNLQTLQKSLDQGAVFHLTSELPERLQPIKSFLHGFFSKGSLSVLERPTIGVVGTRAASAYGKACTQKFVERLVDAGLTIVSGGALGIDSIAHQTALKAGCPTVAVFATGIDGCYPASHRNLFDKISQNGALVSQFPVGHRVREHTFLQRNAVTAILSDAVLIIEAPEKSGALSTAHAAIDQGRQVFVVPSNVSMLSFRGSHQLIRLGATLVDHPDQILEDMNISVKPKKETQVQMSDMQAQLMGTLSVIPKSAELIALESGLDPSTVLSELTLLELEGQILRDQGGYILVP